MAMPSKSVEWTKIPYDAIVEDAGRYYRVRFLNGQEAVAYWGSLDAREAQLALKRHAERSKNLKRIIRSFGKKRRG